MRAVIDVGSNTLRMLIGEETAAGLAPKIYRQKITRLAGGYRDGIGLAAESMQRTLAVFTDYVELLQQMKVDGAKEFWLQKLPGGKS